MGSEDAPGNRDISNDAPLEYTRSMDTHAFNAEIATTITKSKMPSQIFWQDSKIIRPICLVLNLQDFYASFVKIGKSERSLMEIYSRISKDLQFDRKRLPMPMKISFIN